jgi:predicted short-subunit dehydrogenase-like oxidoreductase (DUF2520 family)
MGQVPRPSLTIVGNGKVARHFSHFFHHKNLTFKSWNRNSQYSLAQAVEGSSLVLLLIQDSAIESFIQNHPELNGKTLVHFSGCLSIPLATGMHPLMSFGSALYDESFYDQIPFICEEGREKFEDLFPTLKNPVYYIDSDLKPLYHALCVMSGNFSVILWQKFFTEIEERFKIPRESTLPYLKRITENLSSNPNLALTGPLQRKDLTTIEKNLSALKGDTFQKVYKAFLEVYQ